MGRIRQDLWSDNGPCDEVSKEMCLSLAAPSSTKLDALFPQQRDLSLSESS